MRKLVIVDRSTGQIIPLTHEVYVVDYGLAERHIAQVSFGEYVDDEVEQWVIDNADLGRRLDNYNMGNLFFGDGGTS